MGRKSSGHIEQLPSGAWRVKVYAGTDPLTGREIRLRKTCKTERAAQIELGRLLEQAEAGRQPEANATVAELMDKYAEVADWDLSTRKAYEAYIRRVIKPALGHLQVRKIRGPLLDLLYAQLRRCGDPRCTGKKFVEHRNVPTLSVVTPSGRPAWQQVADTLRDAIGSGMLAAGESLPSVQDERASRRAGRDIAARLTLRGLPLHGLPAAILFHPRNACLYRRATISSSIRAVIEVRWWEPPSTWAVTVTTASLSGEIMQSWP